jgi:4-amino-4-deoxy-L-arabinose transferase-like glycosyltransferase
MTYYNFRVTGDALAIPYVAHQRQYMVAPLLCYQTPRRTPPEYHHQDFYDFHNGLELNEYRQQISGSFDHAPSLRSIGSKWTRVLVNCVNQVPIAALLLGAVLAAAARRGRAAFLGVAVCVGLPAIHFLVTPWFRPAYMAPLMPFLLLLFVIGMRELSQRRAKSGLVIVRIVVLTQVLGAGLYAYGMNAAGRLPHAVTRAGIAAALDATPGKHLVLVRYGPHHSPLYDVVYNGADIDHRRVIWARSMGEEKDAELLAYFKDRDVVRLEFNENERTDFVVSRW